MASDIQNISGGHQIPLKKEEPFFLPKEIWIQVFSSLEAQDLANCARVCSNWNKTLKEEVVWKALVLNKFGSEAIDLFETYVKEQALSWKEVYQFPTLAPFITEIILENCHNPDKFESENIGYEGFTRLTSPFASYGDFRFSITNSTDIKVRKGEDEPFILKGEEGKQLSHLAAEGDFVFALRQDGKIIQWNYKTGESQEVNRISEKSMNGRGKIRSAPTIRHFVVKGGCIIIVDKPKIEIIPYQNPKKSIILNDGKLQRSNPKILKKQNKIFFVEQKEVYILDFSVEPFSYLKHEIRDANSINCVALGKDILLAADTSWHLNRQILIHDLTGQKKQRLSVDLNHFITSMVVKKDLIFCYYNEEEKITQNSAKFIPSLAILDLNTGKTLSKITDIFDNQKRKVKPEAIKDIFNFLKTDRTPLKQKTKENKFLSKFKLPFFKK